MPAHPRRFAFTLTAGRTGTHYLTELLRANLPDARVHHELLSFQGFGVDTPDVSHMTLFNSRGNVERVRAFWRTKLRRVVSAPCATYVETSHLLMKAGLIENLAPLLELGEVHLVDLRRDRARTVMSYLRDHHFANRGMWWMWYLDPAYPNKIVPPGPLAELGMEGAAIWYVLEVEARAEYYRLLLADEPRVHLHRAHIEELNERAAVAALLAALGTPRAAEDVVLPPPQSPSRGLCELPPDYEAELQRVFAGLALDPAQLAREFHAAGRRLEHPQPLSVG